MNGYERAQALGLTGTDDEIIAQLRAVTTRPINLAYLMETLNFRGMLRKTDGSGGQERWQGTLQNLKSALVSLGQSEAVEAYETWFSHVTNPRQTSWDTSIPAYAVAFAGLESNFAGGPAMPTVEDFAAVTALGGGRPYDDLTVEQYATQKDESIAVASAAEIASKLEQDWASAQNEFINANVYARAALVAGLRFAADKIEAG